jgi:hypothetical protein
MLFVSRTAAEIKPRPTTSLSISRPEAPDLAPAATQLVDDATALATGVELTVIEATSDSLGVVIVEIYEDGIDANRETGLETIVAHSAATMAMLAERIPN